MDVSRSFKSDPYLWLHLAGIAAVPLWLGVCLIALATGDPVLPVFLEFLFVVGLGIAPILWMQWQRPFYIYSLLFVALKPDRLTPQQQTILRLFRSGSYQVAAAVTAVVLAVVGWELYQFAPIAAPINPLAPNLHLLGVLIAAIAFLLANLFLQVPISVMRVLLTSEATFATTQPIAATEIPQTFTLLGFPVPTILPQLQDPAPPAARPAQTAPAQPEPAIAPSEAPDAAGASPPLGDVWDDE